MRVVVIGAGPAGLIALRSLQKHCEDDGVEFVCYERRAEFGGEWVLSDGNKEETYDKAGHPMNRTVYKELRMNTPTVLTPPHPDHDFPPGTPLYPFAEQMSQYFKDFTQKFSLEKYILYNKMVQDISFDKATSKFSMKVTDLKTDVETEEHCDYVLVCVGQYCDPRMPDTDFSKFSGEVLHYHYLKDPARLNGKRLLVVGGSWGAMDMVLIFNKPNRAASMHLSWFNFPPFWMNSVKNVPMHSRIESVQGNTVKFTDGTSTDVDAIILASGFKQVHPLSDELQLDFSQNRFLFPLYKHFIHPRCPKLVFLGKASSLGMFAMRPQAEAACMMVKGRVKLPSEAEMMDDIVKEQTHWGGQLMKLVQMTPDEISKDSPITDLETAMGNAAAELGGVEPMYPAKTFKHIYYQCLYGILYDVMNFKAYTVEYRPNPENPGETLPYLVPPKNNTN